MNGWINLKKKRRQRLPNKTKDFGTIIEEKEEVIEAEIEVEDSEEEGEETLDSKDLLVLRIFNQHVGPAMKEVMYRETAHLITAM